LEFGIFLVFGVWCFLLPSFAAAKPLNLLLITADDLNGDSMSWMGSKVGATPNMDAFAATCHQFRNCHVSAPICQPSRSAFMTGRVPHRNGAPGFNPINLDVPTMTEVTSSNGFFTAAINKTGHMMPRQKFQWDLILEGSGKNPQALRAHLEQCLKAAAAAGKPFFINANSTDPHRPFAGARSGVGDAEAPRNKKVAKAQAAAAPVKMFAESEVVVPSFLEDIPDVRKEVAQYFSSVRRLDESFRELMVALKAAGHLDDTVIVFLGDHGMSFPYSKATLYRNGTWTPLLLRWPGMGKPVVNTDMVSSVYIMPTALELLGVKAPEGLDGRSWLPLLRGEKQPDRDHVFTHVNTVSGGKSFPGRCVRTLTRAYIWNAWPDGKTQYRVEAMSGLSWAAMANAAESDLKIKPRVQHFLCRMAEEFYDEEKDADERHNLIADPKHQAEIQRMKKLLLAHMEKTGDPLLEQFAKTFSNDHKASKGPLTRPADTLSPSDGERDGVRGVSSTANVFQCIEPDKAIGTSVAAVVAEGAALAHTAQVFPVNRRGNIVPATNVVRHANVVLENLDAILKSAGSDLGQVVKLNVYLAQGDAMPKVQQALARRFSGETKPAVSFVVGDLAEPGALVAMDAVAASSMETKEVKWFQFLNGAPLTRPSATLSPSDGERDGARGIASVTLLPAGSKVYVSDMADTNSLVPASRKTLEELVAAIGHLGSQPSDIVQLKVFLQPLSDIAAVRKEVVDFFGGNAPPTVFVEWISANLPIEIELIAAAKDDFSKEPDSVSFLTPPGTRSAQVYSRVARINHGKLIYVSGLYGMKASDGAAQVREIFGSLGEVLKKTGSDFEHLAKATYYVTDDDASNKLGDIRPEF
jgi:N-sulfoglucosamine sulfohydrolase